MESSATTTELDKSSRIMDINERQKAALEAGLHLGRVRRKTHPKMEPYLLPTKGEIQIIDISKSLEMLDKALEFISEITKKGGIILLVGIHPTARSLLVEFGKKFSFPYVVERWLGGTLTNFKVISGRIQYLKDLEAKIASGEIAHYTKKERMKINQEAKQLAEKFEGLRNMTKLPDAVFLIGMERHSTCVREARRMGIPIIALCNSNDDPTLADYPIPGNDLSSNSIKFILQEIEKVLQNPKNSESN
jgi:small subunit ribosomal protein S2